MDVADSPTRCPYCHDAIPPEAFVEALVCERCLSRHHPDCWLGRCASCGTEAALGRARAAAPPGGVPAGWRGSPLYQGAKHVVNWSYLVSFLLCFPALVIDLARTELARSSPTDDPFPFAFMTATILTAGVSVLMWGLNSVDAALRRREGSFTWIGPFVLAMISPLTGGLAGFLYYALWGRKPLPGGDEPPVRASAAPSRDAGEPVAPRSPAPPPPKEADPGAPRERARGAREEA